MLELPSPAHMPCDSCGASVARGTHAEHVCDAERRLDYLVFQERDGIAGFEDSLDAWLDTAQGRFARYYAERRRPD